MLWCFGVIVRRGKGINDSCGKRKGKDKETFIQKKMERNRKTKKGSLRKEEKSREENCLFKERRERREGRKGGERRRKGLKISMN